MDNNWAPWRTVLCYFKQWTQFGFNSQISSLVVWSFPGRISLHLSFKTIIWKYYIHNYSYSPLIIWCMWTCTVNVTLILYLYFLSVNKCIILRVTSEHGLVIWLYIWDAFSCLTTDHLKLYIWRIIILVSMCAHLGEWLLKWMQRST